MLEKLAACSISGKTKLVGRVIVCNDGVTRSWQHGDMSVSITDGPGSATRFVRPVGSAWSKPHVMIRRSREPVFRVICGQRCVFLYARTKFNHHLRPKTRVPTVHCTDAGSASGPGYSWTTKQTLLPTSFVLFIMMRRFGQNQMRR